MSSRSSKFQIAAPIVAFTALLAAATGVSANLPARLATPGVPGAIKLAAVAHPRAGHATPQQAAFGLISKEIAGKWAATNGACSFIPPGRQRKTCVAYTANLGASNGTIKIVGGLQLGNRALVQIVGNLQDTNGGFAQNTAPLNGMPPGSGSFNDAFKAASTYANFGLSPQPCIRIHSRWYVDLYRS